jgi:fructokinase
MTQFRIGFDIGGTKVAAALLGPDGALAAKERWPVPENYPDLLALLQAAVAQFDAQAGASASVGLGIAGVIDHRQGCMALCKLGWLTHQPIRQDLSHRLQRPVAMGNDADCFALSEAVDGAGAPYHHVFGAILGTGVGGGQIVGKRLVTGPNGVNGEWGHLPLPHYVPEDGPLVVCHCGRIGCIETLISGGGLVRLHRHLHPEAAAVAAHEIALLAGQGNAAALATLDHFAHLVARGLTMIVLTLDPDAIVIGGGLRDLPQFWPKVRERIPHYCFIKNLQTTILPARFDADSGVRGAAWLS